MIFVILVLYGFIAGFLISKRKIKSSQAVIPMMAFAILSCVALGHNHTVSLISEANDGIGISNFLAKLLLPGEGWTKELFLSTFELYLGISIVLIILYFILAFVEKVKSDVKA